MTEAKFTPHYLLENLRDVYFAERSGALILQRRNEWRRLFFDRGMIALADASIPEENLPAVLAARGAIAPGDPIPGADLPAPDLAANLAGSGRVEADALESCARDLVATVVRGAFAWDGGTYRFEDREVPAAALAPDVLFTFEVFQRGVQSMANFTPLKEVLLGENRRLRINDNAFLPIHSLNLGPEQGYVLSRVDGTLSINEVAMLAPEGTGDRVLRLLFGFLVLGLVLFDPPLGEGMFSLRSLMEEHRGDRQREQRERQQITTFQEEIRGKDAMEVLGLGPSVGPESIKRAYEALRDRFARDRFSDKVRQDLRRELAFIENRLLECYMKLQSAAIEQMTPAADGSVSERPAVDLDKRKELVKSEAQETEEESQRLAEMYFLKAKDYFKEGDFFNCIQFCKLAVKFNPAEAPFFSLMGDALLKNPNHRWQRLAEESYRKASEIDPWNADYLVALGQLYKKQGLAKRARRHFEKALEILPQHLVARDELRGL